MANNDEGFTHTARFTAFYTDEDRPHARRWEYRRGEEVTFDDIAARRMFRGVVSSVQLDRDHARRGTIVTLTAQGSPVPGYPIAAGREIAELINIDPPIEVWDDWTPPVAEVPPSMDHTGTFDVHFSDESEGRNVMSEVGQVINVSYSYGHGRDGQHFCGVVEEVTQSFHEGMGRVATFKVRGGAVENISARTSRLPRYYANSGSIELTNPEPSRQRSANDFYGNGAQRERIYRSPDSWVQDGQADQDRANERRNQRQRAIDASVAITEEVTAPKKPKRAATPFGQQAKRIITA
jgi:hypothetical protein